MLEMVHASVRQGLRGESGGYAIAGATAGLPAAIVRVLERASPSSSTRVDQSGSHASTPYYCVWPLALGSQRLLAISRTVEVPRDYSGRPTLLTHHVVLTEQEVQQGQATRVLMTPEVFRDSWDGPPLTLPELALPDSGVAQAEGVPLLSKLTTEPLKWAAFLAHVAISTGTAPRAIRVPDGIPRAELCAEILAACPRPMQAHMLTATVDSPIRPDALHVLGRHDALPARAELLADWADSKGATGPPDMRSSRARKPAAPLGAEDQPQAPAPDLASLPPPTPATLPGDALEAELGRVRTMEIPAQADIAGSRRPLSITSRDLAYLVLGAFLGAAATITVCRLWGSAD